MRRGYLRIAMHRVLYADGINKVKWKEVKCIGRFEKEQHLEILAPSCEIIIEAYSGRGSRIRYTTLTGMPLLDRSPFDSTLTTLVSYPQHSFRPFQRS